MPELAVGSAPFTIILPDRVAPVVEISFASSGAEVMFEQAARVRKREAVKKKILKNFFNVFFTL